MSIGTSLQTRPSSYTRSPVTAFFVVFISVISPITLYWSHSRPLGMKKLSTIEKTSSFVRRWEIMAYVSISSMVRLSIASSSPFLAAEISEFFCCVLRRSFSTCSGSFWIGSRIVPSAARPETESGSGSGCSAFFCFISRYSAACVR